MSTFLYKQCISDFNDDPSCLFPKVLVSLVAQMVKGLPAVQETWLGSLGGKDPLEKGMTTHSRILA